LSAGSSNSEPKPNDGSYRVVQNQAEADRLKSEGDPYTIVVPALDIQHYVKPTASAFETLVSSVNAINALRSIRAFRALKMRRKEVSALEKDYRDKINGCHERLAEPVGGGPAMENAWFQGWSAAQGVSALSRLTSAHDALHAALDRKSAYARACFSLYVAVISIILTTVFGFLSI
jgi:hypothetical protein